MPRCTLRLLLSLAFGVPALRPVHAADEPGVVALPPFMVEEMAKGPPWRYARSPDFEILSRCDDSTTRQLTETYHRLHRLLALVLPEPLQVKHAVALAQEDVRQGAVFADVREDPETQLWRYQKAEGSVDSGVVYNVNSKTGELTRHPGYLTQAQYMAPNYRFEAPRPSPTHETPHRPAGSAATPSAAAPAASSAAAPAPARPRYALHNLTQDVAAQFAALPTAGLAALIYAYAYEGWGYLETAASRTAAEELARLTGGMLTTDQRTLTLGFDDDQG